MKKIIKIDKKLRKVLLIGANGFLGANIINLLKSTESLNQKYSLIATDILNNNIPSDIPFYSLDITERNTLFQKVEKIKPELIILTAAMTDVDNCEIKKSLATEINLNGPINVFQAAQKLNIKVVFLSTDFVFDGKKRGLYSETDEPNPISHYGLTKFKAELALQQTELEYLICRTAVLYGWNEVKLNFITWILEKLHNEEEIKILTNQINSPTYIYNLAEIIFQLIENESSGIYHTAGNKAYTRYEMALKCAEIFEYDQDLIIPIEHFKQKALRPPNGGLDVSKIKHECGNKLKILSLEEGLVLMKETRRSKV